MAETRTASNNVDIIFKIAMAGMGLYAGKKLGEFLGVFQTQQEQEVEEGTEGASQSATSTSTNNPYLAFNPNYAIAIVKAYNKKFYPKIFNGVYNMVFSQSQYLKFVTQLFDAKDIFNDDEDAVYGIFRQITTQWQLSLLSGLFFYFKKKDLLEYLKGFMNPTEVAKVLAIVKNYPQYRKA